MSGKRITIRCDGPHMPMRVEGTRGNLVTAAKPLVNKLPMVEQRRLRLKARLASRLVGGYRNEGVQVEAERAHQKAERDISR